MDSLYSYGRNDVGAKQPVCLLVSEDLDKTVSVVVCFRTTVCHHRELSNFVGDTLLAKKHIDL